MQVIEFDEGSTRPNVLGDSLDWKIYPHLAKFCRKVAVQSHIFPTFSEFPLNLGALLGVIRSGAMVLILMFMHRSFHL